MLLLQNSKTKWTTSSASMRGHRPLEDPWPTLKHLRRPMCSSYRRSPRGWARYHRRRHHPIRDQPAAQLYKNTLERRNLKVYTPVAPRDNYRRDLIVSKEGYGATHLIETRPPGRRRRPGRQRKTRHLPFPIIIVISAQCRPEYAKFATFPIWTFPRNIPSTLAYEAACRPRTSTDRPLPSRDLWRNRRQLNRDVEAFPSSGASSRESPRRTLLSFATDMGVNRVGFGIVAKKASRRRRSRSLRRVLRYRCEYMMGLADQKPSTGRN
jgi:uncharacterized protein (UPF0371 family)